MPEDQWIEFAASGKERRHNHALAAAILILTYHVDPSEPEAIRCGRIADLILDTMHEAEAERTRARLEPSQN
jgi:hypothetical protein